MRALSYGPRATILAQSNSLFGPLRTLVENLQERYGARRMVTNFTFYLVSAAFVLLGAWYYFGAAGLAEARRTRVDSSWRWLQALDRALVGDTDVRRSYKTWGLISIGVGALLLLLAATGILHAPVSAR